MYGFVGRLRQQHGAVRGLDVNALACTQYRVGETRQSRLIGRNGRVGCATDRHPSGKQDYGVSP